MQLWHFWRAPRRKVYEVEKTTLQTAADVDVSDESSDVDDAKTTYAPLAKRFRRKASRRDVIPKGIHSENHTCLFERADDNKCCICHTVPIRPPIVVLSCCGNILGCKEIYIDQMTGASEDDATELRYPLCRSTEFSASRLNSLDGLMTAFNGYNHIAAHKTDD